jgi:cell division cycle 2-like protein
MQPPSLLVQGCRSVEAYQYLNCIDEGTYGVVYRARDKSSQELVALKKVKLTGEKEGFPITALREISLLQQLNHPGLVKVKEVVVGSTPDKVFIVMEYLEHELKSLLERHRFSTAETKCLMQQLLRALSYLHDNWVVHRDLKTSNLLLDNRGQLKICDFGLARKFGSPLRPYTQTVVTLHYRAPELLLGVQEYSAAIDMWSAGCILGELVLGQPLFEGQSELEQLDKIFGVVGTPTDESWAGWRSLKYAANVTKTCSNSLRDKFPKVSFIGSASLSDLGVDLLESLLRLNPSRRITAAEALLHPWFEETPLPQHQSYMPSFPSASD